MQRKWQRYLAALLVVTSVMTAVLTIPLKPARAEGAADSALDKFIGVYDLVKQYYVGDVDTNKLIDGALRGMLSSLDPFSTYFDAQEFQSFNQQLEGKFGGVGIQPDKVGDDIVVISALKGSPAEAAGIKAGDHILAVDGKDITGMELEAVLPLIRGEPGTPVVLTIRREKQTYDVTIVRYLIRVETMDSKPLGDGLYYIDLREFNSDSGKNLKALADVYRSQGAKGFVLDLRNNPGGYLTEAVTAAEAFIGSGPVVRIIDRTGKAEVLESSSGVTSLPVVVLVNGGTASASEILAGALQDTGIGTLVGTHTFGKGLVQSLVPLSDGSVIKFTTMKYQTPKGRDLVLGQGLIPEVLSEVPAHPVVSQIAYSRDLREGSVGLDVQTLQQRLASLGNDPGGADGVFGRRTAAAVRAFQQTHSLPVTGVANEATIKAINDLAAAEMASDPQLDKALEVLKTRLEMK